jgi:hypothetical protein
LSSNRRKASVLEGVDEVPLTSPLEQCRHRNISSPEIPACLPPATCHMLSCIVSWDRLAAITTTRSCDLLVCGSAHLNQWWALFPSSPRPGRQENVERAACCWPHAPPLLYIQARICSTPSFCSSDPVNQPQSLSSACPSPELLWPVRTPESL